MQFIFSPERKYLKPKVKDTVQRVRKCISFAKGEKRKQGWLLEASLAIIQASAFSICVGRFVEDALFRKAYGTHRKAVGAGGER